MVACATGRVLAAVTAVELKEEPWEECHHACSLQRSLFSEWYKDGDARHYAHLQKSLQA